MRVCLTLFTPFRQPREQRISHASLQLSILTRLLIETDRFRAIGLALVDRDVRALDCYEPSVLWHLSLIPLSRSPRTSAKGIGDNASITQMCTSTPL